MFSYTVHVHWSSTGQPIQTGYDLSKSNFNSAFFSPKRSPCNQKLSPVNFPTYSVRVNRTFFLTEKG